ncbi:MAG: efflux RND transporter periplasmic adaptor subunit, partial [Planctomycetaceae bacterium]|nr:efflux RND transporter periplasmic adaptor subunit [Planctomycetaceae bacterium]
MSSYGPSGQADPAAPGPATEEEAPLTRGQKFRLVVKVVELRLRFVALMAATALVFAYWDDLWNRYDKWMRPASGGHATVSGIEYYCPMHPQVVQDEPGSCPICGMPLAKRKKGEKATLPPGVLARVQLAPFRVAQAGIKTAEVAYAPLTQTLTTVGSVAFDERRLANIVSKVPGKSRVEKLHVNFTGQDVEVGQTLAELYSPELSQAIQELLNAARRAGQSVQPQAAVARSLVADRQEMVRASAEKLRRWGITQAQIDQTLKTGKTDFTIPILSPIRGHVFKKNVVEGQEVPEGYAMFEVADLRTVWVQAQIYESQLGLIHLGQPVEASVEAYPGETFSGKVEFIQPHLDPSTRTVEVWYALENPGHRLRPGMFATVTLKTSIAETPEFRARVAAARRSGGVGRLASLMAEAQKTCPVTDAELGTMGPPIAVEVGERKVWTCCDACPPKLKADPSKYLARLEPPPRDEVLSVPESAVIDTGTRKVVYVESEPGVFEGREVVLGPRTGSRFPVLEGLAPGEKVAAAGAFLIDAESRINPGAAPANPGEGGPPKAGMTQPRSTAASTQGAHRH